MATSHLSQQAYDRLQEELVERSGPRRKEISLWIERAREHGDIKENADYDAAKNEQGINAARVRQLEQMLANAVVIDANTGQNALSQVKAFDDALGLTGLIVTKLDGTAKGGILAAIARQRPVPVYFIGVGEKLEDLETFNAREFAQALLG